MVMDAERDASRCHNLVIIGFLPAASLTSRMPLSSTVIVLRLVLCCDHV